MPAISVHKPAPDVLDFWRRLPTADRRAWTDVFLHEHTPLMYSPVVMFGVHNELRDSGATSELTEWMTAARDLTSHGYTPERWAELGRTLRDLRDRWPGELPGTADDYPELAPVHYPPHHTVPVLSRLDQWERWNTLIDQDGLGPRTAAILLLAESRSGR